MARPRKVVCLMGPTAAGKTGLAVELVSRLPLDIISVDSALVYRGMDIGTAKPDAETLARAPHRLVDIRDPEEPYSAAEFRDDAWREKQAQRNSLQAPTDEAIRAALAERGREEGWPALHRELARIDPVAAERIEPTDPQRIQRALEVHALTGQPLSELQKAGHPAAPDLDALKIVDRIINISD